MGSLRISRLFESAPDRPRPSWDTPRPLRDYFYALLSRYIGLRARPGDSVVELDPLTPDLREKLPSAKAVRTTDEPLAPIDADYVVLHGSLHYERDIHGYLTRLRAALRPGTRLLVIYYSSLWRPAMSAATRLGLRVRAPETNWLSHGDIANLLMLADLEVLTVEQKVLLPIRIPILSELVNRYLAPLPVLRSFCLVNLVVARPRVGTDTRAQPPSVSVVVPARNEAGNIRGAVERLPKMGPSDELIFVEGGSTDDTWQTILDVQREYAGRLPIKAIQQTGTGKGDAVRAGFAIATKEILMILDADLTVAPEDLPKFYAAIASGKGDFINGSRLVYPMEDRAMQFLNLVANKLFATAFSYVLGQQVKDTLCGTKVLTLEHYRRLAASRDYFGRLDPFGDFDLLFGSARMGLRILEIPVRYRERVYGTTNISRFRHGALLFAMLVTGARRLRFL